MGGAGFLGIWTAMMATMMLPITVPLLRFDHAAARSLARSAASSGGYLAVWVAFGCVVLLVDVLVDERRSKPRHLGGARRVRAGVGLVTYSVSGSYLESCDCEAICPCRMVDGLPGGRSTYGICFGALVWHVEDGRVRDVDVSGLARSSFGIPRRTGSSYRTISSTGN
jgi:hypothetical protein